MDVPAFLTTTDPPHDSGDGGAFDAIWDDLTGTTPTPDPHQAATDAITPVPADIPLADEQPTAPAPARPRPAPQPRPRVKVTDPTGDDDLDQVLETIWAAQVHTRTGQPPAPGARPPWRH